MTRPHSEVVGSGPLHNGRRNGALLHLLHAFTTDGVPLGTIAAEAWTRQPRDEAHHHRGSSEKRVACKRKTFAEKESYRWLAAAKECVEIKSHCPKTQLIMLADRESDITEVIDFCRAQDEFDWIIRSDGSRILQKKWGESSEASRDRLGQSPALLERELDIRARYSWGSATVKHRPGKADRTARTVKVSVHSGEVTLNDPRVDKSEGVRIGAVLVRERKPPRDAEPIEWMLLTSLPIKTADDVQRVIEYYLQRWTIELFFRVLKSGCRIESRRFEHIDRCLPALSLYLIVAWRSLYVCQESRRLCDHPCRALYTDAEWKSVWQLVNRSAAPRKVPTLMEMTRLIAELGGYVNRKNSGPPGPQTVWLGLQQMHLIATCWLTFGPGAKTCV